jgi:exopolysaccharide biosynthesis polyprenyl glycosylphosphotransferase
MSYQALTALTTREAESDATLARFAHTAVLDGVEPFDDLDALSLEPCPPDALRANESRRRRLLIVADAVAIAFALAAVLSGFGLHPSAVASVIAVPSLMLLFKFAGLYDHEEVRLRHSTLDEAPLLLQLSGLLVLALTILRPAFSSHSIGPEQMALLWAALFAGVVSCRTVARAVARRVVEDERCLLIGELGQAERISRRLADSRARVEVVGCVAADDLVIPGGTRVAPGVPGVIRDLVHEFGIHRIIIAPESASDDGALDLIRVARAVGVRVSVLPRILQVVGSSTAFDEIEGMSLLGVPRLGLSSSSRLLKRAFDLTLTSLGLVLLSPILIAIAAAIKLDSQGPVFFRQVRVGRGGRHFRIIKFRSMVAEAEEQKEDLRRLSVAGDGLFKVPDDPRVTRVGAILRSTSLDELPQLLNVLRGEMSLVGPRPLVTEEDAQVQGLDRSRLRLTPGMTGPWQLLGSRVPLDEMVEIDYLYASHWTLWLDLKILLRTVTHVLRRGNM